MQHPGPKVDQSSRTMSFATKLGVAVLLAALAATGLMSAEAFATGGSMLAVDAAAAFAQF